MGKARGTGRGIFDAKIAKTAKGGEEGDGDGEGKTQKGEAVQPPTHPLQPPLGEELGLCLPPRLQTHE